MDRVSAYQMGKIERIAILTVVLLISAVGVRAGTIGPSCSTCFGGIYTLDGSLVKTVGTVETWLITYGLDLSGFNGPASVTYVNDIAAKVVSGPNLLNATLVSSPTVGSWTMTSGNLNSGGCNGSGGGWVCLANTGGARMLVGSGTPDYQWQFDVDIKAGTLMSVASIQANFAPPTGVLMSQQISVPEGNSGELPLLLSGLGIFAFWWKRSAVRAGLNLPN